MKLWRRPKAKTLGRRGVGLLPVPEIPVRKLSVTLESRIQKLERDYENLSATFGAIADDFRSIASDLRLLVILRTEEKN